MPHLCVRNDTVSVWNQRRTGLSKGPEQKTDTRRKDVCKPRIITSEGETITIADGNE